VIWDFSEPFRQRIRLLVEWFQMFRLDLPPAVQLVDDQSGVELDEQVADPASECLLEPSDQSSVLRDVVILHPIRSARRSPQREPSAPRRSTLRPIPARVDP